MKKISVLIVDDHSLIRTGLSTLINSECDLTVIGEAANGREACEKCATLRPDVVLMDLMMPEMDGAEATRRIRGIRPSPPVLILTTFGTSAQLSEALAAGAAGALLKDVDAEELMNAIRRIHAGEKVMTPELLHPQDEDVLRSDFTARQLDILASLTRGYSNADIAKQFGITEHGVKKHLQSIFNKIGAATRAEAVAIALRRQLLKL